MKIQTDAGTPEKILILRALKLGDMLCAVPAFRALKAALPQSRVTLLGLPWSRDFVERFHTYLDDFMPFPGFPGFPEQEPDIHRFPEFLKEVQEQDFDLVLQMQGSGYLANSLVALMGAKHCAGFHQIGEFLPEKGYFLPYPDHEPEVWRHLRLMEFLGFPLQGDELEFPLLANDLNQWEKLRLKFNLRQPYICIHPGASKPDRRWSTIRFASVAEGLADMGYQIVLTGTQPEAHLTREIRQMANAPVIDLAGMTDLGTLGALLSHAALLISNDTGVAHLADAVKTPSVVLFSAHDHDRWAPLDRTLHKVIPQAATVMAAEVLAEACLHLQQERT